MNHANTLVVPRVIQYQFQGNPLVFDYACNAHDYLMILNQVLRLALLTSLALAGANAATLTYSGDDPQRSFDIWFSAEYQAGDQLLPAQGGGTSPGTQIIDVNLTAGVAGLVVDGFGVDALCADFFTVISNGDYNVNLLGPNSISNGGRVAWMLRNILPSINSQANGLTKQQQGAGLQLAAWDILHDGGDGFALGRIRQAAGVNPTDAMVLIWANAYLGGSAGQNLSDAFTVLYRDVNGPRASQQLLSSQTPEPSTYAMMLTGVALLSLGAFRRHRANQ